MARSSRVYYIAPSAVSIIPNANDKVEDLAVYVARGCRIKVYSPDIYALDTDDASYLEWTLAGRNRRLYDSAKPHAIYARLSKTDYKNAYLVFAAKTYNETTGQWEDPYVLSPNTSSTSSMSETDRKGKVHVWSAIPARQTTNNRQNYWWIKVGDVSAPASGVRTVSLDTGILGTDEYNNSWELEPDEMPLRVELACMIDGKDAGQTPYVYWNKIAILTASLVEGWDTDRSSRIDHWTIARNTGDADADAAWNTAHAAAFAPTGSIALSHFRSAADDFAGAVAATFTITAYGAASAPEEESSSSSGSSSSGSSSSGNEEIVALAQASITILTEPSEAYGKYLDMQFCDANGYPYTNVIPACPGFVNLTILPKVVWGMEDITSQVTAWQWHKYFADRSEDVGWAALHQQRQITLTDADMPAAWSRQNPVIFECVATIAGIDVEVAKTVGFGTI